MSIEAGDIVISNHSCSRYLVVSTRYIPDERNIYKVTSLEHLGEFFFYFSDSDIRKYRSKKSRP